MNNMADGAHIKPDCDRGVCESLALNTHNPQHITGLTEVAWVTTSTQGGLPFMEDQP